MVAGSQAAHGLAYWIVYPQASVRLRVLVETGHDYMSLLPLVLGVGGAIVALSLGATIVDAARGRGSRALPPWAFALLPLVGFTLQEFIERWLAWGFLPWHEFAQPTFLVGMALQLPFGVLGVSRGAVAAQQGCTARRAAEGRSTSDWDRAVAAFGSGVAGSPSASSTPLPRAWRRGPPLLGA